MIETICMKQTFFHRTFSLSLSNLVLVCPFLIAQFFLSIRLTQTKRLFLKLIFDFLKILHQNFFLSCLVGRPNCLHFWLSC